MEYLGYITLHFSHQTTYEPKIIGFLPCIVETYGAEILTMFLSYFWRNYYFINSFWNLLTFTCLFLYHYFHFHWDSVLSLDKHWPQKLVMCKSTQYISFPSFLLQKVISGFKRLRRFIHYRVCQLYTLHFKVTDGQLNLI